MSVLTVKTTMLYCPKCRSTYEEGTQRFCSNDGGRLLPAPSTPAAQPQKNGVFTSILGKMPQKEQNDQKFSNVPKSNLSKPFERSEQPFKPKASLAEKMFKVEQNLKPTFESFADDDSILELEVEPPFLPLETKPATPPIAERVEDPKPLAQSEIIEEPKPIEKPAISENPKPLPTAVNAKEIPSGTAEVGNRQTNPVGRAALGWNNTAALIGQTVKGRYVVTEKLDEDSDGIVYLAEDKIAGGKKVVVRVFMSEDSTADDYSDERIALSHINHPNVAAIFDSGELIEGNTFIVSEFVEGKSLNEMLKQGGQFNVKRTARIIRQISYALSEAHQNSILHRNLSPENIILTVSENGMEQAKLINFGLAQGDWSEENLHYKSPEEIEDEPPTFASEIYSLAIIAYQMLTGKLPFNALSEGDLLKAQRNGLNVPPTTMRLDVPPLADKIIEKALTFKASERYPKARDFGDAFFNALTTISPWEAEESEPEQVEIVAEEKPSRSGEFFVVPPIKAKTTDDFSIASDIHIASEIKQNEDNTEDEIIERRSSEERTWERRSPEPPKSSNWLASVLPILGVLFVLAGLWGVWQYLANRENNEPVAQTTEPTQNNPITSEPEALTPAKSEVDMPPPARTLTLPANMISFANNKEKLDKELAQNFLGFELFYPNGWNKKESPTNFLDISKRTQNGSLIEQFLVTRYQSRGSFSLDQEKFVKFAEASNAELKKYLGDNYKALSAGETSIQNGRWKAYEVKFESRGTNQKGENLTIWGRRLWIPVQRPGTQNGYVITLLATSLSDSVKSVEDVGTQGELGTILESFEPDQN